MKKQNMNLPALVIFAFLLQSTVAEDDDGYPKLSNKVMNITVTTLRATQPPSIKEEFIVSVNQARNTIHRLFVYPYHLQVNVFFLML